MNFKIKPCGLDHYPWELVAYGAPAAILGTTVGFYPTYRSVKEAKETLEQYYASKRLSE